ncbi:5,6-dimethylbenzimidazole synthase [mine drainage metagenome]|uniref:5,6-dimethylbenzimidazole synthase n=1 Tax=mine drainage metagenome TaxID=410659 RepID=A0A1J5QU23_9ZZZZ
MSTAQPPRFDEAALAQFEQLVAWRRDVRRFKPDAVDPALIDRLLALACLSPSVGNAQPWRFVKVESPERRAAIRANFVASNAEALQDYHGERARLYAGLKLSGLDVAPVQIAVFCDGQTTAGYGLGRRTMPETMQYSVVAAIQTLWLAARLLGLGVGWVSIIDPAALKASLDVPDSWSLIAHLCIGYPVEESDQPELVRYGWQAREDWAGLVMVR